MENVQKITLDIMNNHSHEYLFANQDDIGRMVEITVAENNVPMSLNGVSAVLSLRKPNGEVVIDDCTITNNKVTFPIRRAMTDVPGKGYYNITLSKDDVYISTIRGDYLVEPIAIGEEAPDVESSLLERMIDQANRAQSYTEGGTGTRPGEDTDNAQWYYEALAQQYAGKDGVIPMGSVTFAGLNQAVKTVGHLYNVTDCFVSNSDFIDGGGHHYPAGTNVLCVNVGGVYKWDPMTGVDTYNITYNSSIPADGQDLWRKPFTPTITPTPTKCFYNDDSFFTVSGGISFANTLNQLLIEKLVSKDLPTAFLKASKKCGCPVSQSVFHTDEKLYLSFNINTDDTQTIWWWTSTGEVHYYDNYVVNMFSNINMSGTPDLSDWSSAS